MSECRKSPVSLLRWIVSGGEGRTSRLHDEAGNLVPVANLWNAPCALVTTLLRVCVGYRPVRPWISYRATRRIARMMRPEWVVLEFGSGFSTAWLGLRCGALFSIEHDQDWYSTVQRLLLAKGLSRVRHLLRDGPAYSDLSDWPDESFDFALIDGRQRAACVCSAAPKIKAGGWLYLDNSDRYREAKQLLIEAVELSGGTATYFTDFVPTSLVVSQGVLVQFRKKVQASVRMSRGALRVPWAR